MKVFFDTVGCRLNQAEIERDAAQFGALGHELVPDTDSADMVIVNTCSVTAAAASDSRGKIRNAAKKRSEGRGDRLLEHNGTEDRRRDGRCEPCGPEYREG